MSTSRVLVVLDNFIVNQKLVIPSFNNALSCLNSPGKEKIVYVLPTFFPVKHSEEILEYTAEVYQWFVKKDWQVNVRFLNYNDLSAPSRLNISETIASESFLQDNNINGKSITEKDAVITSSEDVFISKAEKVRVGVEKTWESGAMGGTFDHIHSGHMLMLAAASQAVNKKLYVGVTGSEMLRNKKYADQLETIDSRLARVREILSEQNPELELDVFTLHDPYGPTLTGDIDAMIVSEETRPFTEEKINGVRVQNNLKPMHILSVPLLSPPDNFAGADGPGKLSSTQLRRMQKEQNKE